MKPETRLNHPVDVAVPADNRPVVAPIYQSVKFEFDTVAATLGALRGSRDGFYYQRSANPTLRQLEQSLASLQGRAAALVCASGVGAMAQTLLALTRQGEHVVHFIESYGPTRRLIRQTLGRFGVTQTLLSIEDTDALARVLAERPTRLIVLESPTNPATKIADLERITQLAAAHGALTVLDNTLAGPHQHGRFPVDLYVHSLTKYAAGHGDVMGGAVIGSASLIDSMRSEFGVLGGTLDPHAAFLIQRGLKSYSLRYRAQSQAALEIATFLQAQPEVRAVRYPGLESHPQHALACRQMSEFGGVLTFELGSAEAARCCAEALKLFALTASLGATDSLVLPSQLLGARDLSEAEQRVSGVAPGTVRLSIGLEAVADLRADLAQALAAAGAADGPPP